MLIYGGVVVDPVTKTEKRLDVRVEDSGIRELGDGLAPLPGERAIDARGCIVAPGLMDAHVHFRDPGYTWKEDLMTGAAAAAAGGFTSVICMANTKPAVDTPQILSELLARGQKTGIRMMQASAVTEGLKGKRTVDMEAMARAGAVLFTDDGFPLTDEAVLKNAMERAAALGIPISLHEEDPLFIRGAGVNEGEVSEILHYGGAAAAAEEIMAARDLILALHTGARVCIQHVSSAGTVALLRCVKAMGADVHAEATPHHFTLTQEAVLSCGTNARMNPPLRTEKDRQAIIEGLKDGTIDLIVTDHAPHSAEEKARPMAEAPSGIIGLETSLGLGIRSLVEPGHLTLMQLIEKMSTNPARFAGIVPASVQAGAAADLVVFSEKETWKVQHFVSRSCNSPFTGWELPGKVHYTICAGKIVYVKNE